MALESSGAMSLGGSTTGRSVNLELGCSATAQIGMNDAAARTLAEVASGAIAMSDFYGKSSGPPGVDTLGVYYDYYGGYYAGTSGSYKLFVSPLSTRNYQFWITTSPTGGASGTTSGDGYYNTYSLGLANSTYPAFCHAANLTHEGCSDWYLGSCTELNTVISNRACNSCAMQLFDCAPNQGQYSCKMWSSYRATSGNQPSVWYFYWGTPAPTTLCWSCYDEAALTLSATTAPIRREII